MDYQSISLMVSTASNSVFSLMYSAEFFKAEEPLLDNMKADLESILKDARYSFSSLISVAIVKHPHDSTPTMAVAYPASFDSQADMIAAIVDMAKDLPIRQ